MERLPEQPAGLRFTLGEDAEGWPRVSWPSVGREHSYWTSLVFLTLWLCGWTVGEVFASLLLLDMMLGWGLQGDKRGPPVIFLVGWLGGWTVGGFFAWRTWLALAFGPRTEMITFEDGQLTFRPGLTPAFVTGTGNGSLDGAPSLQPRVVRRGQVASGLRLEPVGERLRLSIDCGADRVELGAALSSEERLWLHALLKEWSGGGKGEFAALTRAITSRPAGP